MNRVRVNRDDEEVWELPGCFMAIVLALLVASTALWSLGCGGASAPVRAAYSVEVARCIANERAIVDRQGTTREQDEADLEIERARCDEALLVIERTP